MAMAVEDAELNFWSSKMMCSAQKAIIMMAQASIMPLSSAHAVMFGQISKVKCLLSHGERTHTIVQV